MGNIVTLSSGDKQDPIDIFLDFENAQPKSDEEKVIYDQAALVLGMDVESFFFFGS